MITLAPKELLSVLAHCASIPSSYAAQLQSDLTWLHDFWSLSDSCPLPPPNGEDNLYIWHNFISTQPTIIYKKLKICEEADVFPLDCKEAEPSLVLVKCPQCGIELAANKLCGHLAKSHGVRNPLKPYVQGSICVLCLRDFQSRQKLVNHLCYHSNKCKQYYLTSVPKLEPEVFLKEEKQTAEVQKRLRHMGMGPLWSELPITRVQGPLLPIMYEKRKPGRKTRVGS